MKRHRSQKEQTQVDTQSVSTNLFLLSLFQDALCVRELLFERQTRSFFCGSVFFFFCESKLEHRRIVSRKAVMELSLGQADYMLEKITYFHVDSSR
jgi:hypothetical protein